jgi:glutamate-ammonia-ligase adenylyltransferase
MSMSPIQILEQPELAANWLASFGVRDPKRGVANLHRIVGSGLTEPIVQALLVQLPTVLPRLADADRAINNLERFVSSSLVAAERILARQTQSPATGAMNPWKNLLTLFSDSQYLSNHLIRNPENVESIWQSPGELYSRQRLVELLLADVQQASSTQGVMTALRRFKHHHTFRIGMGDLIVGQRIDLVTLQISLLVSALVEVAYRWARQDLAERLGQPLNAAGDPCQFVILAMGKLGGCELNYSSDIDLVMVYQETGMTRGGHAGASLKVSNQEFFERLCQQIVKLIGESTKEGTVSRVDLRLRPNGGGGRICTSCGAMIQYYDLQGRTWERQALIKARPVAGDLKLGEQLLQELAPWIYHRNLSRADIGGIKALKRKIERRALMSGEDRTNIKTGHGGIRDVEFIIQFMQLLNGGDLPNVRTTNTLEAIQFLEQAKCLSPAESTVLAQNYAWLRKLEHRLQMMFDLQTHTLPADDEELNRIAKRMGMTDAQPGPGPTALEQFRLTLTETTESNRKILNHLLHGAFGMAFGAMRDSSGNQHRFDHQEVPLEVDLILDPDPDPKMVMEVLQPYGFQNVTAALGNLMDLAKEPTSFLSDRRCKHFLASVAPTLLDELSRTPDPDASLVTLATVSDCLGAKGVLWELFSFNPPTLNLYVRLCASSDYLVGILRSNPGMIDELVDALQMQELPSRQWLESNMDELTRGAEDPAPIIHSFKNTQHMRVGIRDILGRDDVRDTHRTLSDVAEICLKTVAKHEYEKMLAKYSRPGQLCELMQMPCPLVILGLGKLGGREPNYHSDLDVIFLYGSGDSLDEKFQALLTEGTSLQFFCSELAAAITQFVTHCPEYGRLYELDSRLRPTGKSGALAVSMDEFRRYFRSGQGQLWERQALCKARPVFGMVANSSQAMRLVHEAIQRHVWLQEMAKDIRSMRMSMQHDCSEANLKRGAGGTVDVEFAIQMLQLKHARDNPSVLVPGTLPAIERLVSLGYLSKPSAGRLSAGYQLLRSVEARLRLMNTTARHDLPSSERSLAKLAYLLNYSSSTEMIERVDFFRREIRDVFDKIVGEDTRV